MKLNIKLFIISAIHEKVRNFYFISRSVLLDFISYRFFEKILHFRISPKLSHWYRSTTLSLIFSRKIHLS